MVVLATTAVLLASYLIGSLSFSFILVKRMKGIDLRTHGSGNLGATNAGRVLGRRWAFVIYGLDLLKGLIPVTLAPLALKAPAIGPVPIEVPAGLLAILGHIFPFYLGWRGGKGVATGSGVVLGLAPVPALLGFLVWLCAALAFRFVSLASIVAAAALPLIFAILEGDRAVHGPLRFHTIFLGVVAVIVLVKHRTNVGRILRGTEPRMGGKKEGP
jgi:glycerol-3-phosphate acyltransferase PlsY